MPCMSCCVNNGSEQRNKILDTHKKRDLMKQGVLVKRFGIAVMASIFALASAFVLSGCAGNNYGYTGGVAATVNGSNIDEDTVTKYIQDFRTSSELTEDAAWAEWMKQSSFEPKTVRENVIDYYVEKELVDQACTEYEITVEDSEVQEQLDAMKANYDDDAAWKEALEKAGTTEDEYKEAINEGLKKQRLQEKVASDVTVSDEELLEMFNMYKSMFENSHKSSHILFSPGDEATAQEVLDKINNGEISFEDAAKQYSQDSGSAQNGGDVGWDTLSSFVTEYQDALSGLSKGQMSGLVTSEYGTHIILCTDTYTPAENTTAVADIPTEFVDYMRNILTSQNQSTKYQEWYTSYKDNAEIVINDMPENVPYNIDMSAYESSDETTTEEDFPTVEGEGDASAEGDASTEGTEGDASTEGDAAQSDGSTEGE